ncbi:MBL fold metallo-hydrolase [Rhodococcus sp. NPDC057014]|uniref:MBL fold metallo-hydrolase n=1 Tax=Rhodococcus sp. NPDC057014 TaxID=3346000 RepID=UPI00362951FE
MKASTDGLARAGETLDDPTCVVVTHGHPDHYGLAARVNRHRGMDCASPGRAPPR